MNSMTRTTRPTARIKRKPVKKNMMFSEYVIDFITMCVSLFCPVPPEISIRSFTYGFWLANPVSIRALGRQYFSIYLDHPDNTAEKPSKTVDETDIYLHNNRTLFLLSSVWIYSSRYRSE